MFGLTRRQLLTTSVAAAISSTLPPFAAASEPRRLVCQSRILDIRGKAAKVLGIGQHGAGPGMVLSHDDRFSVALVNRLAEPTLVHWHGQMPPNAQDGVPDVTQPALAPGATYHYDFIPHPGSHWMHSHLGLQRQRLLSAPLIVRAGEDSGADVQEHVLFLHDFTFRDPEEILAALIAGKGRDHAAPRPMHHSTGAPHADAAAKEQGMAMTTDKNAPGHLNDVEFDAYLANDRTLDDPEVVRVERGGRLRLRVINAAGSTNFLIDLGMLHGRVMATDGNPVQPKNVSGHLPVAMAQRIDILVQLPAQEGAWPVLALREGDVQRTGLVLATRHALVGKISPTSHHAAPPVDTRLEHQLRPVRRLPEATTKRHVRLRLTGAMNPYRWGIDERQWGKHNPIRLKQGDRVELTFDNESDMAHPMHIHGHHFKVIEINGNPLDGPFRDTVLVPLRGQVKVAFDAGTPGRWLIHCHNAYHMAPGMMTEIII